MTKEERYFEVLEFKAELEVIINRDYLPLQRKMEKALDEQDLQGYMEFETEMVPLKTKIEEHYDELLRKRNELNKLFAK